MYFRKTTIAQRSTYGRHYNRFFFRTLCAWMIDSIEILCANRSCGFHRFSTARSISTPRSNSVQRNIKPINIKTGLNFCLCGFGVRVGPPSSSSSGHFLMGFTIHQKPHNDPPERTLVSFYSIYVHFFQFRSRPRCPRADSISFFGGEALFTSRRWLSHAGPLAFGSVRQIRIPTCA